MGSDKDKYLMTNPAFYDIGPRDACFSMQLYLGWIALAVWHAFGIYYSVFYALTRIGTVTADGKDIGLWLAGTVVYGSCVVVVNLTLWMRAHAHHLFGLVLYSGSVASYFVIFYLLSIYAKDDIRYLFWPTLSHELVWVALVFSCCQAFLTDYLYKACRSVGKKAEDVRAPN